MYKQKSTHNIYADAQLRTDTHAQTNSDRDTHIQTPPVAAEADSSATRLPEKKKKTAAALGWTHIA
jgi:hypothetical protein